MRTIITAPRTWLASALLALGLTAVPAQAADYTVDVKGAHAFVQFRVKHLGYSWLYGRFNRFDGEFSYDPARPEASKIAITIDTASVDSNHAERDKHLRNEDFLDVGKFPSAKFVSSRVEVVDETHARVHGKLTLKDVTRPVVLEVERIGMGADPWGGERVGFEGRTQFRMKDFNILKDLGPLSQEVEMILSIEGIKK
jgi:polyisoprenoid-binding protein YceI